jgi:hypothetical protein
MNETAKNMRLVREGDALFVVGPEPETKKPVKLLWVRPISARGRDVSIMDREKKEVLMLANLDELDPDSRVLAEAEIAKRYILPKITRVISATAAFGIRYWHVETNLGARHFALKNASKNAVWVTDDHLLLQDVLGCRYEINPYSALDARSQAEVEKVI